MAITANDIWAVGEGNAANLVVHWDGTQWQVVPSPNLGSGRNELHTVGAVGPNDIWAAGRAQYSQGGLILHWDGAQWSLVDNPPAPEPILNGLAAVAADDVWVAGFDYNGLPMIERWDGTHWATVLSPDPGSETRLWGMSHTAYDDVWAVGDNYYTPSGSPAQANGNSDSPLAYRPRAFRYSGGTCRPATASPTPALTPSSTPSSTRTPTSSPVSTTTATPTATRTLTPTPTGTRIATPTSTSTASTASTPTSTSTPCPMNFTDVSQSDYFYEPVRYLYCRGVISGYGDGTFRPYNNTTRGQLAKMVVLAQGWTIYTPPTPTFQDVPTTNAFYTFVETAYHQGIISGYGCGTDCLEYRPGNNITRAQLCKIIVLARGWTVYTPPVPTFHDVTTDNPFYAQIETAYRHNIISGYSCGTGCLEFRPGNNATRGQISKIVYLAVTQP